MALKDPNATRPTARVTVQFSRSSGSETDTPYRLVIVDEASHLQILEVRLTGEAVAGILTASGSSFPSTAELIDPNGYLRVGRYGWNASILLRNDYDGRGYQRGAQRLRNLMEDSALYRDLGAETWTVTEQNNGLGLTLRGYHAVEELAADAAENCATLLAQAAAQGGWKTDGNVRSYPTRKSIADDREFSNQHGGSA